jgi:DNA polymerase-3 subunit alpha
VLPKKIENLAGGFDSFRTTRAQYFHDDGDGITFYEKAIRYGVNFQENENSAQVSLFEMLVTCKLSSLLCHRVRIEYDGKLAKEKEVVGIYISGHPLDDYKFEMKYFVTRS